MSNSIWQTADGSIHVAHGPSEMIDPCLIAAGCVLLARDVDPLPSHPQESWRWVNGALAVDPGALRDAIWRDIRAHRDQLQQSGVEVGGFWLHNDIKSRSQWERMAGNAEKRLSGGALPTDPYLIAGQPVPWKTMAGTVTMLTLGYILSVVDALELQEALIFGRAEQHRAAVNAMTDVVAIAAYDWTTGWPAIYAPAP